MPLLAHVALDLASTDEWQQKAKAAGADGMQILGHVCEGQQLMNYDGTHDPKAYGGQEGEWLSEEYLLATGDVVVKTLTETTETLGLGKVVVEMDAEKTIQIYVDHIEKKRKELGLK